MRLYVVVTGAMSVQELGERSMLTASSISRAGLASLNGSAASCSRTFFAVAIDSAAKSIRHVIICRIYICISIALKKVVRLPDQ